MLRVYSSGRHTEQHYSDHEVSYRDQESLAEVLECQEYLERKQQRAKEILETGMLTHQLTALSLHSNCYALFITATLRPLISGQFLATGQLNIYGGKLQPSTDTDMYLKESMS